MKAPCYLKWTLYNDYYENLVRSLLLGTPVKFQRNDQRYSSHEKLMRVFHCLLRYFFPQGKKKSCIWSLEICSLWFLSNIFSLYYFAWIADKNISVYSYTDNLYSDLFPPPKWTGAKMGFIKTDVLHLDRKLKYLGWA